MNPLQLFRSGMDYLSIASHVNTTEAEVERQIHRLRQEEIDEAAARKREERRAYERAYREENRETIIANRKRHNAQIRANLRDIREACS